MEGKHRWNTTARKKTREIRRAVICIAVGSHSFKSSKNSTEILTGACLGIVIQRRNKKGVKAISCILSST